MDLNFRYDVKSLEKKLTKTQRQVIPFAASSAINRATSKGLTMARREIMSQAGLPQKLFKSRFKTYKASPKRLHGKLWVGLKFGVPISELSAGQRKRVWKKYGVESAPFVATMPSGHRSTFVRVQHTPSGRTRGRTRGRPGTSSRNLPIVDLVHTTAHLSERHAAIVVERIRRDFIKQEFSRVFHREVRQRLKRKGL